MILRIAHRGASGYAPENSVEAFRKAILLRSDVVEFDVRTTKDGELVVAHDDSIDRVTDGSGTISTLTLNEIQGYNLANGERIPTFFEVIELLMNRCVFKIDIKDIHSVGDVMRVIVSRGIEDLTIVTSKIHSALEEIRRISSMVRVELGGYMGNEPLEHELKKIKDLKADILSPHVSIVNEEMVRKAHSQGIDVHVWDVNDLPSIEKAKRISVDGITSDYPDRV